MLTPQPTQVLPSVEPVLPALRHGDRPLLTEADALELVRVERVRAETGQPVRYVVAGRPDQPVGLLPVYPATAPFSPAASPAELFAHSGPAHTWQVGCYLGSQGILPAAIPVSSAADPGHVRDLLVRAGRQVAAALRPRPDFVCLPLLDDALASQVTPALSAAEPVVARCWEAFIEFDSWDGYLHAQPSATRTKIRRERRRFAASGLRVAEVDLLTQFCRLAPLLRNVEARYGVAGSVEMYEGFLFSLALAMRDRVICLAAFQGRDPVAFTVIWRRERSWRLRSWGCDHERTAGSFVYFNLSIYEPLRLAAEAGVSRLLLGAGTLPAKVERGAQLRGLTSVAVPLTTAREAP